jgi:hypothetical protein
MNSNIEKDIDPLKKDAIYQGLDKFSPIPLTVSSPIIRPIDKNTLKAKAYESMQLHANQQINMLRKQAELLMHQVHEIEERLQISKNIYEADLNFVPVTGETYYVYLKEEKTVLSMISPSEWGNKMPFTKHVSTVKLLADKTWELLK